MANLAYGIDVSSAQPRDLSAIINAHQPSHVVVKLYLPVESIPQSYTRDQIASARAAGCTVGGYVWCYRSEDPTDTVNSAIDLAESCNLDLPVLWLDCETYTVQGQVRDPGPDAAWLRSAVAACNARNVRPGIYTGAWWWKGYMGNTMEFGDVLLWAAQPGAPADPASVTLFGGWSAASGKQWSSTSVDRDAFLAEVCSLASQPETLADLETANPNFDQQLHDWRLLRRRGGADPYDYGEFRQFEIAIGAPDPGTAEFDEFCPDAIKQLCAANPNIGGQLATWQKQRREKGEDPYSYGAFRQFLGALGAPDPGAKSFDGFCPDAIKPLLAANPNLGSQLAIWQLQRRQNSEDPYEYGEFRQFVTFIGAPDPGPNAFEGFLG